MQNANERQSTHQTLAIRGLAAFFYVELNAINGGVQFLHVYDLIG